ncbi:acetyl-CoA acetyltransferase [Mycobacteroides abscessus subsp. abscessus]|nr:acetyl-CoA acetyltransferase [Mycobacteroides abscessus subsp. abscessus]
MAAEALDVDPLDERGLTVTGGLPYHGGPGNNYVSHSIVEMVRRCRRDPTDAGLVTGLGWYSTKHSVGVWSARPRWTPIIAHLSDGRRVVARSDDPQIAEAMGGEMYVGKTVCLRNTGSFTGFELS